MTQLFTNQHIKVDKWKVAFFSISTLTLVNEGSKMKDFMKPLIIHKSTYQDKINQNNYFFFIAWGRKVPQSYS